MTSHRSLWEVNFLRPSRSKNVFISFFHLVWHSGLKIISPQNFETLVPMVSNIEDILISILCLELLFCLSSLEASRIFSLPSALKFHNDLPWRRSVSIYSDGTCQDLSDWICISFNFGKLSWSISLMTAFLFPFFFLSGIPIIQILGFYRFCVVLLNSILFLQCLQYLSYLFEDIKLVLHRPFSPSWLFPFVAFGVSFYVRDFSQMLMIIIFSYVRKGD